MKNKSPVFEQHYEFYLGQIQNLSLVDIAENLGVKFADDGMTLPFLGKNYKISHEGILDQSGKRPSYAMCVLFFKYLLTSPKTIYSETPWSSYKDFLDAGPLIGFFSNDVEKTIVTYFTGKTRDLKKACESLGGKEEQMDIAYDLAMQLTALPKIPMLLLFNDADDEFPGRCSVLFRKNVENYLDMESVAILGDIYTKMLIAEDQGEAYG